MSDKLVNALFAVIQAPPTKRWGGHTALSSKV